jgi:UDP-GlcNAc:undecaprenyl-phosphate/decaprenyl-phosphate GlcNAc-1-phosphate transferase
LVLTFVIAVLVSLGTGVLLVVTKKRHARFSADHPGSGPQKLHAGVVPRIGGIAVMAGFSAALLIAKITLPMGEQIHAPVWFILALFVPFAVGLCEDLTQRFGPLSRLVATFWGASIAYFFCGASIVRFDVPIVDALLALHPAVAFVFTLFCVGGIAHAFNLADGLNGLVAGLSLMASIAIATVAYITGDVFVLVAATTLAGAVTGFALLNFPRAWLFSGDGGAYLLGSALAILAILLCRQQPIVSPWFAFILVIYPFTDTTYSIFRRWRAGRPIMSPDAEHLHSLLAQRWKTRFGERGRNLASVAIVAVSAAFVAVASLLFTYTSMLVVLAILYAVMYVVAYRLVSTSIALDSLRPLNSSGD